MRKAWAPWIILLLSGILCRQAVAQTTRIYGVVRDSASGEVLPMVNVFFKGTTIGTTSGFDGKFSLSTHQATDTLVFSSVGYYEKKIRIKRESYNELDIKMISKTIHLKEVVIFPSENPAFRILREVWKHKDSNNLKIRARQYSVRVYNKIQFDANNITDDFRKRKVFKPFEFIFDHVDTSEINGKSYLPLMLTEAVSEMYYRKRPSFRKEKVLASRASGINNESISQFLGNTYQQVNIYDNYISLFNRNFVSPIARFGKAFYRYYLVDSATIDGHWCYKLVFKPKRKKELTFVGNLWVADSSWAIKKVNMKIADNLNINFINAMTIEQSFMEQNGYWFPVKDYFVVDFNVLDNNKSVTGFYAHKTTIYSSYNINKAFPEEVENKKTDIAVDGGAYHYDRAYWDSIRPESLSTEEQNIYKMVDTLVELPVFKSYYNAAALIYSGYYNTDYVDIGPYFRFVSYNAVEGLRLRVGGRTSNKWNNKIRLFGHAAYGIKDQRFKYEMGGIYLFKRDPRRALTMAYKKDMEVLGESVNALKSDNIIASVFRRRPFTKLSMVDQKKIEYEHEYFHGLSNKITLRRRNIYPLADEKFIIYPNEQTQTLGSLISTEVEINLRFAYKEAYLVDKFKRTNLGTKYPVFNVYYTYGIPHLFGSRFEYHKLNLSIRQFFNVGSFGWSRYVLTFGKTWGTVPYPLLNIAPGNETYSYDKYAFNKMNYYEFISDEVLAFHYAHHFDGLFLNHIPLMRELEWREVVYFKAIVGRISEANKTFSKFPRETYFFTKPYYESGVGLENIFKVLRIDAGWRFSYLNHPNVNRFGLMATMYLHF